MLRHEVTVWQAVTASRVVYLHWRRNSQRMCAVSRATSVPIPSGTRRGVTDRERTPVAIYQAVGSLAKRHSKLRRARELSPVPAGLDLADKLRVFQRALRSRVERRDALLDIVRAVNSTLEPAKIADLILERAATWVPAPCWAIVSSDLSMLADRGLMPEMAPAVFAVASWVMQRGEEFVTDDLRSDARVSSEFVGR